MGLLSKVIGTHSEREVRRVIPIVDKIEALEPEMEKLSDEELRGKTAEFKKRLAGKETLDDILYNDTVFELSEDLDKILLRKLDSLIGNNKETFNLFNEIGANRFLDELIKMSN